MDATIIIFATQLPHMATTEIFKIDTLFRDLIWRYKHPRIKLETLPKDVGGLASQLQQLYGWSTINHEDPINKFYSLICRQIHQCSQQLLTTFYNKRRYPTFYLRHRIWTTVQQDTQYEGYTQYIWNNLQLPEVAKLKMLICGKSLVLSFLANFMILCFSIM